MTKQLRKENKELRARVEKLQDQLNHTTCLAMDLGEDVVALSKKIIAKTNLHNGVLNVE